MILRTREDAGLRVRLGSLNRAKLEAVRCALAPFWNGVEVQPVAVESGVSEQPIGFDEILAGALARARSAYLAGACDLSAGLEDGLVQFSGARSGYLNVGCCVLYDGIEPFAGLSAGFEYPPACVEAALSPGRVPVGESFDEIFSSAAGRSDPGPGAGNIGRLTGGVLTRVEYGKQAVLCALVRMLHPALYASEAR